MTEEKPSRWEVMARERNARVIMCNTPDTYAVTDLARHADKGIRALRNRLLITLSAEQVLPLLEEYKSVVLKLHEVISKIHKVTELDYKVPRSVQRMLTGDNGKQTEKQATEQSMEK